MKFYIEAKLLFIVSTFIYVHKRKKNFFKLFEKNKFHNHLILLIT